MKKKINILIRIKEKSMKNSNKCRISQINMMRRRRNTVMKDMKMNMKDNLKKK